MQPPKTNCTGFSQILGQSVFCTTNLANIWKGKYICERKLIKSCGSHKFSVNYRKLEIAKFTIQNPK